MLAHEGAPTQVGADGAKAVGPIVEEVREMSDAVDVVVAGHSHSELNLRVPNATGGGDKLVVEALSYGTAYDSVELTVDHRTGDVVRKSARVLTTHHGGVPPDPGVRALVAGYARRVAPLANRIVGRAAHRLTRRDELPKLAADAQRRLAGTDIAMVTPASLRADIDASPITYAEVAAAQAYDHPVMRMEMTGHDLIELLESAGDGLRVSRPSSAGPLDPQRTYTVAASELIATGDWFPALRERAWEKRPVGTEVEALVRYLAPGRPELRSANVRR